MVNIAPLCDPDSSFESRVAVASQLHEACKDVGFFYIVGHGCPSAVSDGVRDAAREWFARPTKEKNLYKIRPGTEGRGYQGLGANVTRYDGGFARDWHEAIDLYKDFAPDHTDVVAGKPLHVPNPTLLDAPELNAAIEAWRDESLRVGAAVLRGIALGLGLDENFFVTRGRADDPFWVMRVINYPPLPSVSGNMEEKKKEDHDHVTDEEGTPDDNDDRLDKPDNESVAAAKEGAHLMKSVPLSCGEHTDYGLLTIVNQDVTATAALQVQNATGSWVDAPAKEGSFVCNIGDMLQIWTNGLYQPTVHRVLHTGQGGAGGEGGDDVDGKDAKDGENGEKGEGENTTGGQSRISVPFFFEPNFAAVVAPLPQFCCGAAEEGEGEGATDGTGGIVGAKFEPVVYGEHLTKKVYSNFVEGSV